MKRCQKFGQGPPPPHLDKIQKNSGFFRAPFPYCNINVTVLSMVVGKSIAFADKELADGHNYLWFRHYTNIVIADKEVSYGQR